MVQEAVHSDIRPDVRLYVDAVRSLPYVEKVLVDDSEGLTIYTVYHGDLASVAERLFGAEAYVVHQFPDRRFRFEVLDAESLQSYPLPANRLSQVFSR